jgi:nucleotide-binding universal stress UspA family protein
MYKHILIATDGTELSDKALHQGLALAKALGAEATVVTATEPWESVIVGEVAVVLPPEKFEEMASANAMGVLNKAKELAEKDGVACRTLHVRDRQPADGFLAAAQENGCDLIDMGSHGRRGLSRMELGSKANEVITNSTIQVLNVR